MGKLTKFVIEFSNESAVYNAGETLCGGVCVELSKPMHMRGIKMCLLGRGKVHWSEYHGKNDTRHYRAEEVYMDERWYLIGSASNEGNVEVPAGSHRYPFSIDLDSDIPSSFEGTHGYVRYTVQASIDRPWKFNHDTRCAFTVLRILDLNTQSSELMEPCIFNDRERFDCCCFDGPVSATVHVNRRCFVPGETILVNADIVNNCGTDIKHASVSLVQITEFLADEAGFFSSGCPNGKLEKKTITRDKKQDTIPSGTSRSYSMRLSIPPLPPSRLVGCNIINMDYKLRFHVKVICNDLRIKEGIVIGTVPLRATRRFLQQQVVTMQPSASTLSDFEIVPPTYEQCVGSHVSIKEENDSKFLKGSLKFAPKYPVYRQSLPSGDLQ